MKLKEVHDLLLSLVLRGLGIWLLFWSVENIISLVNDFVFPPPGFRVDGTHVFFVFLRLLAAIYFVRGAPPFLKWATHLPMESPPFRSVELPPVPQTVAPQTPATDPGLRKD